jgi:hypothetical protein
MVSTLPSPRAAEETAWTPRSPFLRTTPFVQAAGVVAFLQEEYGAVILGYESDGNGETMVRLRLPAGGIFASRPRPPEDEQER